jgi:TonB family protein
LGEGNLRTLGIGPFKAFAICLLLLVANSTEAQEEESKNDYLRCTSHCTDRVPPVGHPERGSWLPVGAMALGNDALVHLLLNVTADGHASDVKIERLYGRPVFGQSAIDSAKATQFQPATENGKPVDYHGLSITMLYLGALPQYAIPIPLSIAYSDAIDLAKDGKVDAAIKAFDEILNAPQANLYGRCMAAYAEAKLYWEKKDIDNALYFVRIANMQHDRFLPDNVAFKALHLEFAFAAASGQYVEALNAFDELKKNDQIESGGAEARSADDMKKAIAATTPVTVRGWVHDGTFSGSWRHQLFRRIFEFHDIKGKLDHFELLCDGHSVTSVISETAAWTVPKDWSKCNLYVLGEAGTTFQFYEQ